MTSRPKILLVGAWLWPWYQEACALALESLGCEVLRFAWHQEFYGWQDGKPIPVTKSWGARIQNRLLNGPILWGINWRLLQQAKLSRPEVIWFYNCTHIFPATIRALRRALPGTLLVQYANDNPFGKCLRPDYWRHLKRSISLFDVHFVYRQANEIDFQRAGARLTHLLRSYYIPEEDYRVTVGESDQRYFAEVVFAGHYESDERLEMLEAVANTGCRLNLYGGGWDRAVPRLASNSPLRRQFPVEPVVGEDYRRAISGAKIALGFLSKINGDTYTRRNFQIPAMKTFMLNEYSDDLTSLYQEGVEAEYFRSQEELLEKIQYYLKNDEARERIALAGYERVKRDGHDVYSRMKTFLKMVNAARRA